MWNCFSRPSISTTGRVRGNVGKGTRENIFLRPSRTLIFEYPHLFCSEDIDHKKSTSTVCPRPFVHTVLSTKHMCNNGRERSNGWRHTHPRSLSVTRRPSNLLLHQDLSEASRSEVPAELVFTHPTAKQITEYICSLGAGGQPESGAG